MHIARGFAWVLVLFALATRAVAQALYGATAAGSVGELYTLNPATGAMLTDVGPLNDSSGLNYGITGLAFHPVSGTLYGSTHNLQSANAATLARLVRINPTTGMVTPVGAFNAGNAGRAATMTDIAFDAAGNLYGVGSVGGPQLYSININTGQATIVGTTGITSTSGGGLEFSAAGTLYGTPTASRFGTYNTTTGAFTNIADPVEPIGGAYAALAFNPANGTLYGLDLGPTPPTATHLTTFNVATGGVTDLGPSVNFLDAIAFQVPEPGTGMLLLAVAIVPGLLARRRARA
jgi:hypothetical protein